MSNFFNKYPYTDFHELNIDWLLTEFKKLQDSYQGIIDWMENDAANFNELLGRIMELEREVSLFQSEVDGIRLYLDQQIARVNTALNDQYTRITNEYTALYNSILVTVNSELYNQRMLIDQYKIELVQRIEDGDAATRGYVEAYLQTFIDNLPDYEHLIIYNPVQAVQTDIQTAINDLYNYFNAYALTAQQYDNLMLTADEYDGYGLTAFEYDSQGMQYLGAGFYLMRSPFSGKMEPIPTVIQLLFDLHRTGALTAGAYDALDMSASYYDGLNLAAYTYDMGGV